eukprot:COSAG01_NODE_2381_length_7792_cov_5.907578_5_plen_117_part_00
MFVRGVVPPGSVLCVWPGVSYTPSELPYLPVRPQPTPVRSSLLLLLVLLRAVTDRRTACLIFNWLSPMQASSRPGATSVRLCCRRWSLTPPHPRRFRASRSPTVPTSTSWRATTAV